MAGIVRHTIAIAFLVIHLLIDFLLLAEYKTSSLCMSECVWVGGHVEMMEKLRLIAIIRSLIVDIFFAKQIRHHCWMDATCAYFCFFFFLVKKTEKREIKIRKIDFIAFKRDNCFFRLCFVEQLL